jgi:uncharacterized membrane protein
VFGDFPIQFDRPGWLVLLLLLVPAFFMSRRSIGGLSRGKAYMAFAIRAVVILLLTTALAQPVWETRGEGLTVTVILDRSQSVPLALKRSALTYLQDATEERGHPDDRLALITVAKDATIVSMPDKYSAIGVDVPEPAQLDATNLAAGVRTALAIAPDDTANRFILVSDGNETEDSVLAAADLARANGVPIDVLVLEYEHAREVIFERLVCDARARLGSTAQLRLVLRSQSEASGRLSLKMNDEFLDLNGDEEGVAMRLTLPPGPSVIPVTISLDQPGPMQFDAIFEPDDTFHDGIARNNNAVGVTFVGSEGKVLIVDETGLESQFLVRALEEEGVAVDVQKPAALARGAVYLSGYDALVLANVPRYAVTDEDDRTLHAYVHDLGGGLVMLGGPESFGAGGWIDSEVAKVLPVKLDPPQTRQIVRGALALIMHSTEMPQGNFWGQKVAIAAIDALSRLDYVGIIDYDWNVGGTNWTFPLQEAGDKTAAIAAAKRMIMGDMPDFASAMQVGLDGLLTVSAGQRHMIIISDGDPAPPSQKLVNDIAAAQITVTTVLVTGHGTASDRATMRAIANRTGGRFYEPKNPNKLPQIFIKEAQLISRSLIVEGDTYQPQIVSFLPGPIEGFATVPALHGYILTAPREGLSQIPMINATTEGNDPIYAHWNYGLGKTIAFTSDLRERWGSLWASWGSFKAFWEQSIRWVMRPSAPSNLMVNTTLEGDRAVVDVEALDVDASFLNFLRTSAVVLNPDAEAEPLVLQQIGPGRYRGEFRTDRDGAYLININFVGGSAESRMEGNIQAAVSVPYPAEYRAVKHNAALLREVAERTGGRVLAADPLIAGLFDRSALEVPRSPRSVWDLLAIIAAAIFVLDVATRRISIDRRAVAEAARRAVGKRAEVGDATMAAWKRVASRRPDAAKGETVQAQQHFEAGEADQELAIDAGAEQAGTRRPPPAQRRETPVEAEEGADEGDYTSRLLRAKRRARGADEETDDDKGGVD